MGLREDLNKKIERKRAEIAELQTQIRLAEEYLQALEDTLKMLPREGVAAPQTLRHGSALAKARDIIEQAGRPVHITELLQSLGKPLTRIERSGLSGSLAAYVRRGEIFTRPAPNTFGLIGMKTDEAAPPSPPPGFGKP